MINEAIIAIALSKVISLPFPTHCCPLPHPHSCPRKKAKDGLTLGLGGILVWNDNVCAVAVNLERGGGCVFFLLSTSE